VSSSSTRSVGETPVEIVLWDADGVLQHVPGGFEESMRPAVAGLVDDVEAFLVDAVAAERPALRGEARWLEVLPGLLERWGIADAYDDVVRVLMTIEEVPGTRAVVERLRGAGIACHLATNQAVERGRHMHTALGYDVRLDGAFYSYRLGVAKPDPAFFTRVLAELGAPPDRVLFVDDNAANVAAARSVGLRAERWSHELGLEALRAALVRHGLPTG
jgi:putative hydrolase of the HAD superfamily